VGGWGSGRKPFFCYQEEEEEEEDRVAHMCLSRYDTANSLKFDRLSATWVKGTPHTWRLGDSINKKACARGGGGAPRKTSR
jgi:hypothetical protein